MFIPLEDNEETNNTVALLHDAYYGSTPQKKIEATNIRKSLRRELSSFKNLIREYEEAEEYDKEDLKCAIRREVKDNSAFTAFKRWILWDNKEKLQTRIKVKYDGYNEEIKCLQQVHIKKSSTTSDVLKIWKS